MLKKYNIFTFILISVFFISSVIAQEAKFNGPTVNELVKIKEETDKNGQKLGSIFLKNSTGDIDYSMANKLWIDDDNHLRLDHDLLGIGWSKSGNTIRLQDGIDGRVFIGGSITENNTTKVLHVYGQARMKSFKMDDADKAEGKVLTSDVNGVGTWRTPSGGGSGGSIDGLSDGKSTNNSESVYLGDGSGINDDSYIGNTISTFNTAIGINALNKNGLVASEFGKKNTAVGFESLKNLDNNNADENSALGYQSHFHNISGHKNTAIGNEAMFGYSGGFGNIGVGYRAMFGGSTTANGQYNTAIGYEALKGNITGNYNIAIGYKAGETLTGSDQLVIQNRQNAARVPLIWGSFAPSSVKVHINVSNISTHGERFWVEGSASGTTSWGNSSDRRLKKNIITIENALEKVRQLRGVNFEWKDSKNHRDGKQIGFIAQEANGVIPEVVGDEDEYMSMMYAPITALLVEAMKEQQKIIEDLKEQNYGLEKRLTSIERKINVRNVKTVSK
ncbi:MAG: tail fiber domain-containing protein [Melioribacteraceae bacterium]